MFEVDPCLPDPPLRSIPHFPHLHSNRPNQSKLAENSGLFLLKLILTSHGQHNNKNISRVKNCPEITILSSQIGHCSDRGKAPNLCFRCFLGFVLIRRTQRQDRTEAGCDWSCERALAHHLPTTGCPPGATLGWAAQQTPNWAEIQTHTERLRLRKDNLAEGKNSVQFKHFLSQSSRNNAGNIKESSLLV